MSNRNDLISEDNGIYILRQQMPYPLQENNAYLAESGTGWTVIDLGIDIPGTRELWNLAVKTAGISFKDIKKIILTHYHPDHLGAAAWMQKMTGAPVFMSQPDFNIASKYVFINGDKHSVYREMIRKTVTINRFGAAKTERLISDWCEKVLPFFPAPEHIGILDEETPVILNGFEYRVRTLPGHTDGQIALWCKENRFLFSGDIFAAEGYLHFTDWPHTDNRSPLTDFFSSLNTIEEMDPLRIYAGHGRPLTAYKEIFTRLRHRHIKLLDLFEKSISSPVSAGELYENIFPVPQTGDYADYIHYHRVLIGETIGYLNYLKEDGRITSTEKDGSILYCRLTV